MARIIKALALARDARHPLFRYEMVGDPTPRHHRSVLPLTLRS